MKQKIIITLIISVLIMFCFSLIIKMFAEAAIVENDMTYCEKMCYPNDVETEILDKTCICLPEVTDSLTSE